MCVSYETAQGELFPEKFKVSLEVDPTWPREAYQDYPAPIIRRGAKGAREVAIAFYSMVPKRHIPPEVKRYSTMNARFETVGQLRSYKKAWAACQLCLVPMMGFFEPNYETDNPVRWKIGMADGEPFAVAGLWRSWGEADGSQSNSFTQLTINADTHPLMKRFHKHGDEKRSLVIVPESDYDDFLNCTDPELARTFMKHFPAEAMTAYAAPAPPRAKKPPVEKKKKDPVVVVGPSTMSLFD